MLRFRELLEACLFECLFSPLAFLSLSKERETADCDPSRSFRERVDSSGETTGPSRRAFKPLVSWKSRSTDVVNFFIESKLSATSRSLIGQRSFPRIVRAKAHNLLWT